jgi:hypothetical protein
MMKQSISEAAEINQLCNAIDPTLRPAHGDLLAHRHSLRLSFPLIADPLQSSFDVDHPLDFLTASEAGKCLLFVVAIQIVRSAPDQGGWLAAIHTWRLIVNAIVS